MASIWGLLDTSILIDLWRGNPLTLSWLQNQQSTVFGLPVIVCMELIDGARNNVERDRAAKLLANYPVVHLTTADSAWANAQHTTYQLSHNVGILDALIAAPAARLSVRLHPLKVKHFASLPDIQVINPY